MRSQNLLFASALTFGAALLCAPSVADACEGKNKAVKTAKANAKADKQKTNAKEGLIEVTPEELALKMAEAKLKEKATPVVAVDVNSDETRQKFGIIPGAVLLSSSSKYDLKELPEEKSTDLVFYCSNERCSAAGQAAKRALEAGYQNVSVLPVGIMGWKKAGYKTEMPRS